MDCRSASQSLISPHSQFVDSHLTKVLLHGILFIIVATLLLLFLLRFTLITPMATPTLLFVIVGRNEPLYEAEFNKPADNVTRQNFFVLHSALDLVEKAAWTTGNMYLRVVDKVSERIK
jgi:hypothetical protein